VDFGGAAETLTPLPEPGLSDATTVVVNAREALAALEVLAAFAWGDDGDGANMEMWPDAAAVVAGLGPRLLEAPGVEEDGDEGGGADMMTMDRASSAALLFRLRVAGALGRALPRLASVAAAAAAAAATATTAGAGGDDENEEEHQHEQQQRRRLAMLRASVQGALQALLNAALSEARREGRQALFASALLVADSGGEEGDGLVVLVAGEGGGGGGGAGCLDPFLAAPGPVGVLLQAARDEDLEVGTRIDY
jgi:hypothetical protein